MEEKFKEIFDRMSVKYALPLAKDMKNMLDKIEHERLEELIEHNIASISEAIKKSTTNNIQYTIHNEYICGKSLYKLICDYIIGFGYGVTDISSISGVKNNDSFKIEIHW